MATNDEPFVVVHHGDGTYLAGAIEVENSDDWDLLQSVFDRLMELGTLAESESDAGPDRMLPFKLGTFNVPADQADDPDSVSDRLADLLNQEAKAVIHQAGTSSRSAGPPSDRTVLRALASIA